jgi:uncharacterized circularly permuted ATP-grasp superfamily protein
MIRYYLKQDPILANVETYRPLVPAHLSHVVANLDKLVVKSVNESGGYGMLVGPAATRRVSFVRAENRKSFCWPCRGQQILSLPSNFLPSSVLCTSIRILPSERP